jgi:hypothetical protein
MIADGNIVYFAKLLDDIAPGIQAILAFRMSELIPACEFGKEILNEGTGNTPAPSPKQPVGPSAPLILSDPNNLLFDKLVVQAYLKGVAREALRSNPIVSQYDRIEMLEPQWTLQEVLTNTIVLL